MNYETQAETEVREGVFPFNPPTSLMGRGKQNEGIDPFLPEGVEFHGVSPALLKVRVITTLIFAAIFTIPFIVLAIIFSYWFLIEVGVAVAFFGWLLWLIPRQVRAIGYAEAESDLLIRRGIMWKSLTVVPYGRLQYVDVSEGPIARAFGIATVQLHTASASTDASIHGLSGAEAARLRSSLAERGESEMAGL
ncbi:MAG: PH domain-containing protein [Actinomycetaceae bacterium]|nr:PH domain-containing protein [Actinomycetaceae bacterium]